jgi:glycine/D-amino acid oxidase-like deaminating enzyme
MHGPAIGQIVAEMITGAAPSIDVRALRPERFAEGDGVAGASLL